jgi:prolyl-tRNA synthetase
MAAEIVSSIADRLKALSIAVVGEGESNTTAATPVKTYAFKPKGSADVPKLVLVVAEEAKDIGKASALAKKIGAGMKDMRAAEEDYLKEIIGDGRANGGHSHVLSYSIVCQC